MSLIKREDVAKNFKAIVAKIEKLEEREIPTYSTTNKYVEKVGYIHELKTVKDVVKAKKIINAEFDDYSDIAEELEINAAEIEKNQPTFMGFKKEVWDADIKTRLKEIQTENLLVELKLAKKTLKKNLSDDDKFDLDMEKISGVLSMEFND